MIQATKIIGSCLATIGLISSLGLAALFVGLILCVARNTLLTGPLFSYAILGFAFAEVTCLFALMLAFFFHILIIMLNLNYFILCNRLYNSLIVLLSNNYFLFLVSFIFIMFFNISTGYAEVPPYLQGLDISNLFWQAQFHEDGTWNVTQQLMQTRDGRWALLHYGPEYFYPYGAMN